MIIINLTILKLMNMKNFSLWEDLKNKKILKKVDKDLQCDVLIVGGGITGISTLYNLKNNKVNSILIERNVCGYGTTSKSTAKITYLQENIYKNIRDFVSYDIAYKYLESQRYAVNLLKDIIIKNNIDCDFNQASSYIFTNDKKKIKDIEEEYDFLKRSKVKVEMMDNVPFNEEIVKALRVDDTYMFHPLKYINYWKELYQDSIYENSKLTDIHKNGDIYECRVNGFIIKAKYLVIANHYPYFLIPFLLPLKSHIEASYIGAVKTNDYNNISAINIDKPAISFRYYKDNKNNYFIYLYNSYITSDINNIKDNFKELENKYKFQYIWSNNDIITNDYIPFIGAINDSKTLFIGTGYNTWGFTNGSLAGKVISDIILKKDNPYIELFDPKRSINYSKIKRLPKDISLSIKAYIKSNKDNKVQYKEIDGKKVAIYIDDQGIEHKVLNKCPHMKCGVIFNEVEKTWECLCHGSRFDIDGKVINGPSNYDITFK